MLGYGRQWVDEDDIQAVVEVLRSDRLTQGPVVERFEEALAEYVGADHAVAFNSGTAALHAAYHVAGVKPGTEVLVPAITFAATANAVLYCGGRPVFVDAFSPHVPDTSFERLGAALTEHTDCWATVDMCGHPWQDRRPWKDIGIVHTRPRLFNGKWITENVRRCIGIVDASHALGAVSAHAGRVGNNEYAEMTVFSFHPVKAITTGEGGAVTTGNPEYAEALRCFRDHGFTRPDGLMVDLGYNYRMTDIQAALGRSQLRWLRRFLARRLEIVSAYHKAFCDLEHVALPRPWPGDESAWHLYSLQVDWTALSTTRDDVHKELADRGVGTQVHYMPVYHHPWYRRNGYANVTCPNAEQYYERTLTIPLYPAMSDGDVQTVIEAVKTVLGGKVIE